jgi:DNA-binding transcriptional LysR family regulator
MSAAFIHDGSATGPHAELIQIRPDSETRSATRRRSQCTAFATLNLNALLIFAKVAEVNSFSEGARRLRIPVSTVSRQVADLETQLGVRLLERSTRRLRITDIGVDILEEAFVAANIRESILGLISSQLSNVSGVLRISAPLSIANSLIMPLIGAFQASYPDVQVHLTISGRSGDLSTSDSDLLFKIGPIKDSSQISRRILTFRHRLLASPAYLKNRKTPETPRELPDHRLLALSSGEPKIEWSFTSSSQSNGIILAIEPYLSVNDPATLASALLAGSGIGNLPSMAAGDLVQNGQLIELMPQWRFSTLDVSIVHASSRHVRRPVQEFIRLAAKLAPALFPPCHGSDQAKSSRNGTCPLDALAVP